MTREKLFQYGYCTGGFIIAAFFILAVNEHRDAMLQVNATEVRAEILKCHMSPLLRSVIAKYPLPFEGLVQAEVGCDFPFQYFIRVTGDSQLIDMSNDQLFDWARENAGHLSIEGESQHRMARFSWDEPTARETFHEIIVSSESMITSVYLLHR